MAPQTASREPLEVDKLKKQVLELVLACNEAKCDFTKEAEQRGWGCYHGGRPGYHSDPENEIPHLCQVIDLADRLGVSEHQVREVIGEMIQDNQLYGCACGCRGDLSIPGVIYMLHG